MANEPFSWPEDEDVYVIIPSPNECKELLSIIAGQINQLRMSKSIFEVLERSYEYKGTVFNSMSDCIRSIAHEKRTARVRNDY